LAYVFEGNLDGATATHATTTVSLCVRFWLATVAMPVQAWSRFDFLNLPTALVTAITSGCLSFR
jgi:hypothetical protein